jgi:hypothetical protein
MGCGSDAATIDAIAQIGLLFVNVVSVYQTMVVAIITLIAKRIASKWSNVRPSRFMSATAASEFLRGILLVTLGRISEKSVYDASFRGIQRDPVLRSGLQREKITFGFFHRLKF